MRTDQLLVAARPVPAPRSARQSGRWINLRSRRTGRAAACPAQRGSSADPVGGRCRLFDAAVGQGTRVQPPASGDRSQQVGGSFGAAILAVILQHSLATHSAAPAAAFDHAFVWALLLSLPALVAALFAPGRQSAEPAPVKAETADTLAAVGGPADAVTKNV